MEPLSRKLNEIGVDTKCVINRLGGNEKLYLSICRKFLADTSYSLLREALSNRQFSKAHDCIHTLKGVAANLGFEHIRYICNQLMSELEQNELHLMEWNLEKLAREYQKIISVLNEE